MTGTEQQPPPQSQAGIDRAGTGHGGVPDVTDPARHDAADPATQRPGEQEGPTTGDGSQVPPPSDPERPSGDGAR